MKNLNKKVSSEELVANYLVNGGKVTVCKNHNPSSNNRTVKVKGSKHWVSDGERNTGFRKTSVFQRQVERELGSL
jgi:hypothetical protein